MFASCRRGNRDGSTLKTREFQSREGLLHTENKNRQGRNFMDTRSRSENHLRVGLHFGVEGLAAQAILGVVKTALSSLGRSCRLKPPAHYQVTFDISKLLQCASDETPFSISTPRSNHGSLAFNTFEFTHSVFQVEIGCIK